MPAWSTWSVAIARPRTETARSSFDSSGPPARRQGVEALGLSLVARPFVRYDSTGSCRSGNGRGNFSLVELSYEHRDGIAQLTLGHDESTEATIGPDDAEELLDLLGAIGPDQSLRALLLTSDGPDLCIGARAKAGRRLAEERGLLGTEPYRSLVLTLAYLEVPTIAAVRGRAIGIGLGVALASDVVIASDDARFGHAFATLGKLLDADAKATLVKRRGLGDALRSIGDTRRLLSARDAKRHGIVSDVVRPNELLPSAAATATVLGSGPVDAWRSARVLARLVDARFQPGLAGNAGEAHAHQAGHDPAWGLDQVTVPSRARRRRQAAQQHRAAKP